MTELQLAAIIERERQKQAKKAAAAEAAGGAYDPILKKWVTPSRRPTAARGVAAGPTTASLPSSLVVLPWPACGVVTTTAGF